MFKNKVAVITGGSLLFHFFLDPQTYKYSEEFIHLHFDDSCSIRTLLEMMVMEYANPQEDTQDNPPTYGTDAFNDGGKAV